MQEKVMTDDEIFQKRVLLELQYIRQQVERIDNLESSVQDLRQTTSKLVTSVEELRQTTGKLESSVEELRRTISRLETSVAQLDSRVGRLERQVDRAVDGTQGALVGMQEQINTLRERLDRSPY
jgi:chromosome segregation ATPase